MWSLEFGDFAADFIGNNLDDNQESFSMYKWEGDQLFWRHKG
jgi:hypothetical protein